MSVDIKKFFYALASFLGTIIGVGLFGLPYVAMKSGVAIFLLYFLLVGCLVLFIHLLFGEVVLRTPGVHRLPGYVGIYLGELAKKIVLLTTLFGFYGALLAYLIVGGNFLQGVFNSIFGGSEVVYGSLFFLFAFFLIIKGSQVIAETELFFLGVFFVLLFILGWKGSEQIFIENLNFLGNDWFLPYGVVLFSLWGLSVVPEARDLLSGKEKLFKKVLITGIVLASIVYVVFAIIVLGISGGQTSDDAIIGLKKFLSPTLVLAGLSFGVITTFTSFLTLGLTLKKIFYHDYHLPSWASLLLSCGLPFFLYLAGVGKFIKILGLVGAIAFGLEGILVLLMHQRAKTIGKRAKPEYQIKLNIFTTYCLIIGLILGVFLEIILVK